MSVKIMSKVWEESRQSGSALLMLLAIADHANDDGVCWPSIATLAAKARVQERQARNLIAHLAEAGELQIQHGRGRGNTSIYVVTPPGKGAIQYNFARAEKGQSSTQKGQSSTQKRGNPAREKGQSSAQKSPIYISNLSDEPSEPSIEPSIEPLGAAHPTPPELPVTTALDGEPLPVEPEAPTTTKTLAKHPAVTIYRDTFLAFPSRAQMHQIVQAGVTDLEQWQQVTQTWLGRGYNPRNIGGMLEWYGDPTRMAIGSPSTSSGNRQNGHRAAPQPATNWDDYARPVSNPERDALIDAMEITF